jgi:hypothetical protein
MASPAGDLRARRRAQIVEILILVQLRTMLRRLSRDHSKKRRRPPVRLLPSLKRARSAQQRPCIVHCYLKCYISISLNRMPCLLSQLPSHPCCCVRQRASHVVLAAIVRTRTNSRVQRPFDQAPHHHHFVRKELAVEIAGLSRLAGVLSPQHYSPLQKWHTPK